MAATSTDSKRQSLSSKGPAPAPRLSSQGPGELHEALGKAIGARVKITTAPPQSAVFEGTVFTACPITNIVALAVASPAGAAAATSFTSTASTSFSSAASSSTAIPQSSTYHFIPIGRIQSFTIVVLPEATPAEGPATKAYFEAATPAIGPVDLAALRSREQQAIQRAREHDASRGRGVGKEGQDIFDALARTLPVRWNDTTIIVSDSVMIAKPYYPDNCTAPKAQQNALERVRRVLEDVRRKIVERNSAAVATAGTVTTAGAGNGGVPGVAPAQVKTPPVGVRKGG